MTVMVAKKRATLADIPGTHPDIHHLPHTTLRDLGDGGSDPADLDYAAKVAQQVYENWTDQTWRNGFIMALHSYIDDQVEYHRGELQAMLDRAARDTIRDVRRKIVKAYLHDALDEVAKDRTHVHGYTTRAGTRVGAYTAERHRAKEESESNPAFGGYDPGLGYGTAPTGVTREEARQQGAALATQTLDAFGNKIGAQTLANKQRVEYHVMKPSGEITVHQPMPGTLPAMGPDDIIVKARGLGLDKPVNLGGAYFNVAQALGTPTQAAAVHGAVAQHFNDAVSAHPDGWARRLKAVSGVLAAVNSTGNPQLDAAIKMASAVGTAGPEVSKVLGGHIRRHLYRYRGVQADPSQWTNVARSGRQETSKEGKESVPAYQYRLAQNLADNTEKGGLQAIPTLQEVNTALQTGNTPPSHGFLLNKSGVVKAQAHGYADDHYVPFNLAQLHDLNGGSYVRSRAFGGPTTEDFALASRTGADSFMTVSRSGGFRVQFTQRTNKRGRKMGEWARDSANDANTAMVNRYGRILDAIKSGKIEDPANPGTRLQLDANGYGVALETLRKQFPYFIKDIQYIEPKNLTALNALHGHNEQDKGYVRPYYLRPATAHAGYHDPKLRRLSDPTSFDEDDRYRLGMARILAYRPPPTQGGGGAGGVITPQGSPPRGTPGAPPTTVGARPAAWARAAATQDIGAPISEATRSQNRIEGTEEFPRYVNWIRARLDAAPRDVFNGSDPEARDALELRDVLAEAESPGQYEAQDKFLMKLQEDPDERARVEDLLQQITPDGTDLTGMERPVLKSLGEEDFEEPANDYEEDQDYKDYNLYRSYLRLKGNLDAGRRHDPNFKLKPQNMAVINLVESPDPDANGMSIKDKMEEVDDAYGNLPYWQYYGNYLHKENPQEHPDRWEPPEDANPDPSSSRTAVHEEDDDETKRRKSEAYEESVLRDMDDRDLYG